MQHNRQKISMCLGSAILEIDGDDESISVEIINEQTKLNVVETMVTLDPGQVVVFIEALKMFKNRIEK